MIKILPSILADNMDELGEMLHKAIDLKNIHIDFIDGKFVDNETPSPIMIEDIEEFDMSKGYHDAHLMVDETNLIRWVQEAAMAKFTRIIIQMETINGWSKSRKLNWDQVFHQAQRFHWKGTWGIAIDLLTPVSILTPEMLDKAGVILVMSVKAGFGGQEFSNEVIKKIKRLSKLRNEHDYTYKICVDGGITTENIKSIVDAGADEVAIGRRLFSGDLAGSIERYKKAAG